jgi:hypothetical protein
VGSRKGICHAGGGGVRNANGILVGDPEVKRTDVGVCRTDNLVCDGCSGFIWLRSRIYRLNEFMQVY